MSDEPKIRLSGADSSAFRKNSDRGCAIFNSFPHLRYRKQAPAAHHSNVKEQS